MHGVPQVLIWLSFARRWQTGGRNDAEMFVEHGSSVHQKKTKTISAWCLKHIFRFLNPESKVDVKVKSPLCFAKS